MHQSERVSSTSGNDHLDNNDNHQNNNDEDSDMDSWPEDTTSPNDSKDIQCIILLESPLIWSNIKLALDFYSDSEYDDTEASSSSAVCDHSTVPGAGARPCTGCTVTPGAAMTGPPGSRGCPRYIGCSMSRGQECRGPSTGAGAPPQPFRYTRKIFSNHRYRENLLAYFDGFSVKTAILEKDLGNKTWAEHLQISENFCQVIRPTRNSVRVRY